MKNNWIRPLLDVLDKEALKGVLLGVLGEGCHDEQSPIAISPLRIGNKVLIRTVTHYHTGKIEDITKDEVILSSAAWIADVGRFYTSLSNGELNEVEPFPDGFVSINRGGIIDVANWPHDLPKVQK